MMSTGEYIGAVERNSDVLLNNSKDIVLTVGPKHRKNYIIVGRHRGILVRSTSNGKVITYN